MVQVALPGACLHYDDDLQLALAERVHFKWFHRRAEVAARFGRHGQAEAMDGLDALHSGPAPFLERKPESIFVLLVVLDGESLAAALGPTTFMWRIIKTDRLEYLPAFGPPFPRPRKTGDVGVDGGDLPLGGTGVVTVGQAGQRRIGEALCRVTDYAECAGVIP
jgi:hypothetical protein